MSLFVDIEKDFKGFHLRNSFTTEDGCLGILGASGCGKSMTLKCIAGIIKPDRGRIVLNGRTLFDSEKKIDLPPQERRVGYLFQNYALFPKMTVRKNLEMGMLHLKKEERKERLERILADYQLETLADRYPSQLSGGQQQRTALARIMGTEPELLLLDEPFSALDLFLREQIQSQVRQVLKDYTGDTILVTHDIAEVRRFCDRALVMADGRKLEEGETGELFRDPVYAATARLSGVRNFFPVTAGNDTAVTGIGDIRMELWHWDRCLPLAEGEILSAAIRDRELVPCEREREGAIHVTFSDVILDEWEAQVQFCIMNSSKTVEYLWWRIPATEWKERWQTCPPEAFAMPKDRILFLKE